MTGTAARATLRQRAFVGVQYLLPQHFISRLTHIATRVTIPPWKNFLIEKFMKHFAVDLSEAQQSDPRAFASFNEFFTRALRPEVRPIDETPGTIVSPVDGTVSAAGRIEDQQLVQAKGRRYTLEALLAGNHALVEIFRGGEFATIYLAPFNYHRIHMPVAGKLTATVHVPGRLFSVNAATAAQVTDLFARNERVICAFDTECGRLALILVGALNVGSMETVWTGEIAPSSHRRPTVMNAPLSPVELARGAEMGRFNMGSTVILLCERGRVRWLDWLREGAQVRLGVRIGECIARPHEQR
jgi:phosphatidylserine decarboxylase